MKRSPAQDKYDREALKPLYLVEVDKYGPIWSDKPKEAPHEEDKPRTEDAPKAWNFD